MQCTPPGLCMTGHPPIGSYTHSPPHILHMLRVTDPATSSGRCCARRCSAGRYTFTVSFSPQKCTVRAEAQQHHSTAVVGVYFHRLNPMQPARLSSRFLGAQRAQRPLTRPSRDLGCRSFGDKFREFGDKFREFEEKVSQSHESRGVVCGPAQLALLFHKAPSLLFMCPRKCPLLSVTCVDLQFHFT